MAISASAATWFLLCSLPICLWAAWSDLKYMKIPNKSVLALTVVFIAVGVMVLPLADMPWRLLQLVVVLVIGFVLNMAGLVGAGDAKFAAAMAPFVVLADLTFFLVLFALVLIVAFIAHRLVRVVPAVRRMSPDWISWGSNKFPMGTALGGALAAYLALGALYGA